MLDVLGGKAKPAEEAGRERHPFFGSETLLASPSESGSAGKKGGEKKKRPRLEELVRFVRRNRSIKQSESFFL